MYGSEPLRPDHKRAAFSCGVAALDRYFHRQASQDRRRKIATSHVFVETATGALVGYYTLNAYTIIGTSLPEQVTKKLPRHPGFPAIPIGRLSLDERYRGQVPRFR
jgi:hypothetical protein